MEKKQTVKKQTKTVRGIPVSYREAGRGIPLVLLHGWGASSQAWEPVMELLEDRGLHLIAPDLPGFGDTPAPSTPWDVYEYASFTADALRELSRVPAAVLGHSFGGRVAIAASVKHPSEIHQLILVGAAGLPQRPDWKMRMVRMVSGPAGMVPASVRSAVFKKLFPYRDYAKTSGVMREVMKKIVAEDLTESAKGISQSTLLIWGELDRMVPLEEGYRFRELIPQSTLHVIAGAGHSPNTSDPSQVADLIADFLLP